jgi:hypothetical protein
MWGAATLAIHSAVIAALIRIRDLSFGTTAWILRGVLRVSEFWVYRWVLPWFNDPRFAKSMFEVNNFLSLSTLRASAEFYEWFMLSIFGGVVYAGAVLALVRQKEKARPSVVASAAV